MAAKKTVSSRENTAGVTFLTGDDLYLFNEGNHYRLYEKFGAHTEAINGMEGTHFSVWAPDAAKVSVIGDFNGWDKSANLLGERGQSGVWEGFIPGVKKGDLYKYHITSRYSGYEVQKADPFAFYCEQPPKTSSIVWDTEFQWADNDWMQNRKKTNSLKSPISIYEVHIGSWMRVQNEKNRWLTYRELAPKLADYVAEMGFTHVEFLPVMEHPFYGSWGYQVSGFFAPTSRYGTPQDFMYLIDYLHQHQIGVILDWVPSHFPTDDFSLGYFDGTHLYEHSYPEKGFHPDWKSFIFNYGRNEVRSFLLSSALFWLDKYHADGLRLDAVASMLYLDYSRQDGNWIKNKYGGRENLEAIDLLRKLNEVIYAEYPDVQTTAEDSTAWPMVSRPTYAGGLGFGMKWDMGWMHDMLAYMSQDPVHRKFHHNNLTFRMLYGFTENFVLPLSHDEVVHGKGSLISKMPGDYWQKFANLRALFGYMFGQPGKKLLFMGGEFGQWNEWYHEVGLDWGLLRYDSHAGLQRWVEDLLWLYRKEPALHENDFSSDGFEWIDCADADNSVISFIRKASTNNDIFLVVCNFTPVPRYDYRVGAPREGMWAEYLNSDSHIYYGTDHGNFGSVKTEPIPFHNRKQSLNLTLPPLSTMFFKASS